MKILKCKKCGATTISIVDCNCKNCGIMCCGEKMMELVPNTEDAAFEKHIPNYRIKDDLIEVKVNHVMEEKHYIQAIIYVHDNDYEVANFKPKDTPEKSFKYYKNSKLYSLCNKHNLWEIDVK